MLQTLIKRQTEANKKSKLNLNKQAAADHSKDDRLSNDNMKIAASYKIKTYTAAVGAKLTSWDLHVG